MISKRAVVMMTNKNLQRLFNQLNERFFDNRLESTASFRDTSYSRLDVDALYSVGDRKIVIDSSLRSHSCLTHLVLLHEMVHADLCLRGYKGYSSDGGHGMLFYVEVDRLYREGAYDGIL